MKKLWANRWFRTLAGFLLVAALLAPLVRSNSLSSFLTFLTSPCCIRTAHSQTPPGIAARRGPVRSAMRNFIIFCLKL